MREIEFVNDLCCNYLIIRYEGEEEDFALRMMEENTVAPFLPMELRRLNGETFLYYNISGMQNMEALYGEKQVDRKTFQDFMWQLHGAIEESRELFLPGDGICLRPAALFRELGTGQWKFIYIPVQGAKEIGEMQQERESLAEFLVMHMDYEDRELTEAVYRFYEEVSEGTTIGWGNLSLETHTQEKGEREKDVCFPEETTASAEAEEAEGTGEAERVMEAEDREEKKWEAEGGVGRKSLHMLLCVALAVTLVSGWIRPEILPYGVATCMFLAVVLFVSGRRRKELGRQEEYKTEDAADAKTEEGLYHAADEKKEYGEKEDADKDRTVYMDIESRQERKLYGVGKYRRQKIFLERLPCLVGKDKSLTDHVIEDSSVSRMHAKFSMEEETVWMQDLNSTNGTYHNGMRLKPHEKVALELEDEIGFGQTQFVFR